MSGKKNISRIVVGSLVIVATMLTTLVFSQTAYATKVSSDILEFVLDYNGGTLSTSEAKEFAKLITNDSAAHTACSKSGAYYDDVGVGSSKLVSGPAAWSALETWLKGGSGSAFATQTSKIVSGLYGYWTGNTGAPDDWEYQPNTSNPGLTTYGWCNEVISQAVSADADLSSAQSTPDSTPDHPDGTTKSDDITKIASYCKSEFIDGANKLIENDADIRSFLTDMSSSDYNTYVAVVISDILLNGPSGGATEYCQTLVNSVNENNLIAKWRARQVCSAPPYNYVNISSSGTNPGGTYNLTACVNGYLNQGNSEYCADTYKDSVVENFQGSGIDLKIDKSSERKACGKGQEGLGLPKPPQAETPESTSTCTLPGGVGWLVCPVFNFLANVTDGIYHAISDLLKVPVKIFDTNSGTYNAWAAMRNIANVGLVIVFLIIIFSQISSVGVTNYGVKKLLPRLIVAAILINASYVVSQLAVDVSNILGSSLKDFLDNVKVFTVSGGFFDSENMFSGAAMQILGAPVAGVAIGTAVLVTAYTGIGLLVPVLLAGVLAVIVTFLILVARQALIILLIVISPLAFLAMLLPNTENYFKQWRKVFIALLLIFPAVALLFGGGRVASGILLQALDVGPLSQLAALAVMVIPLFAVPVLLKNSLNAIPAIGNLASKLQSRANGLVGSKAKEFAKSTPIARGMAIRKQARENYRARKFAEDVEKGGIAGLMAGGIRYDKLPGVGKYAKATSEANKALVRTALVTADEADTKDRQAQKLELAIRARKIGVEGIEIDGKKFKGESAMIEYLAQQMNGAMSSGDTTRAKAAYEQMREISETGAGRAFSTLRDAHKNGVVTGDMHQSMQTFLSTLGLKPSDGRAYQYAKGDMEAVADDTYTSYANKLTDQEYATQIMDAFKQGLSGISSERAAGMVANAERGTLSISPEKLQLLRDHVAGGTADPTSVPLDGVDI